MFTLSRDRDGTLVFRYADLHVPVDGAYLEELLRERHLRVLDGSAINIDPEFVINAIEEALGAVGHELASAEATKRRLLHLYHLASKLPEQSKGVA